MRDSALKRQQRAQLISHSSTVGEELMRDSALKPESRIILQEAAAAILVGEELMRDSALKLEQVFPYPAGSLAGRRRAHARQRFETCFGEILPTYSAPVGEELMRDSALKRQEPRP